MTETSALPPQPAYAPPPPQKKKHTFRNVMLVLLGLTVLFIGGCFALVGTAANEIDKSIKADDAKPGGDTKPLTIQAGKAFEVDNFNYAAGWRVRKDALGGVTVKRLKVTNNRDKKDSAIVEIKFWKGSEVLALVDCSTEPIAQKTTVTLSCIADDSFPTGYAKITINDSF
jgi:hypothetical protein